jgi:hypothetical protein
MSRITNWDGSAENRDSEGGLAAGELLRRFDTKHRARLGAAEIDVPHSAQSHREKESYGRSAEG